MPRFTLPLLLALVLAAGCGSDAGTRTVGTPSDVSRYRVRLQHERFPHDVVVRTLGTGPRRVRVLSPRGHQPVGGRPTVLFLHGWLAIDPRYYEGWLVHLVRRGNAVVYPEYQVPKSLPSHFLASALTGVRAALAALRTRRGSLVAVGHSAGGTLAADYAAVACGLGLPAPQAVFSVFPARRLREYPEPIPHRRWASIPRAVEVLAVGGDEDDVVGLAQAQRIGDEAPGGRYELVTAEGADTHLAPQADRPTVRRVFWRRFDALAKDARARPAVRCPVAR